MAIKICVLYSAYLIVRQFGFYPTNINFFYLFCFSQLVRTNSLFLLFLNCWEHTSLFSTDEDGFTFTKLNFYQRINSINSTCDTCVSFFTHSFASQRTIRPACELFLCLLHLFCFAFLISVLHFSVFISNFAIFHINLSLFIQI